MLTKDELEEIRVWVKTGTRPEGMIATDEWMESSLRGITTAYAEALEARDELIAHQRAFDTDWGGALEVVKWAKRLVKHAKGLWPAHVHLLHELTRSDPFTSLEGALERYRLISRGS